MIVGCVDWAAAERTLNGQSESGDQFSLINRCHTALVGNVEGVLFHGDRRSPPPHLAADFGSGIETGAPPKTIADSTLARHGKTTDDALVLVARDIAPQNVAS